MTLLIFAVFAVYRLATDLAWESGPFGIYEKLRGWVMTYIEIEWVQEGIGCPICWSFWLSLPLLWYGPIEWLGVAGAAALLVRLTGNE